jgi:hypothetical protein
VTFQLLENQSRNQYRVGAESFAAVFDYEHGLTFGFAVRVSGKEQHDHHQYGDDVPLYEPVRFFV